jgi:hypothetical protein
MARNDPWNDLLVLGPIGTITRIKNRNHLAHHLRLASPDDHERHKHACFNKAERLPNEISRSRRYS